MYASKPSLFASFSLLLVSTAAGSAACQSDDGSSELTGAASFTGGSGQTGGNTDGSSGGSSSDSGSSSDGSAGTTGNTGNTGNTSDSSDSAGTTGDTSDTSGSSDSAGTTGDTTDGGSTGTSDGGGTDDVWTFVALSDSRGGNNGINSGVIGPMAEVIASLNPVPDLVLYPGDMVDVGTQSQLNTWLDAFAPVYDAGIAVYTVPGNHEDEAKGGWESLFGDGGPYQHATVSGSPDGGRTYYVEHKNFLFIGIGWGNYDTSWVQSTINSYGSDKDHIVLFQHKPLVGAAGGRDGVANGAELVATMKAAGSRFYFAGHDHTTNHASIDGGSVHQWIVGMAGAPNYDPSPYQWDSGNPYTVDHVDNGVPDDAVAMAVVLVEGASVSTYIIWWDTVSGTWKTNDDTEL